MKVARGAVDMGISEKYRFSPTFSNTIVTNITTTRRYKDHLLERDRVIQRVTDLDLMTSLIIRRGKERPFPRDRSRAPQDSPDQDFRVLISAGRRPPHLVVVAGIRRRSLCAHDTSQHGVMLLGLLHTLHNNLSVVDHLLTAEDYCFHRMRATMVVDVITAVDPELEATPPRHMSVALPALRNHAGAGSSASFDDFGGEQILGIIPANLESKNLSSEPKPPPTKSFNIAEAPIDQRNSNQHGFGLPKVLYVRIINGAMATE